MLFDSRLGPGRYEWDAGRERCLLPTHFGGAAAAKRTPPSSITVTVAMPECGCQSRSMGVLGPASNTAKSRNTKGLMISPRSEGLISRVMGPRVVPRVRYMISRTVCGIGLAIMTLVPPRLARHARVRGRGAHSLHIELDLNVIADQHAALRSLQIVGPFHVQD
jgi:hypothetical protein